MTVYLKKFLSVNVTIRMDINRFPFLIKGKREARVMNLFRSRRDEKNRRFVSILIGAHGGRETPVPIPNTAVKPLSGYNTWPIKAWENSTVPNYIKPFGNEGFYLFLRFSITSARPITLVCCTYFFPVAAKSMQKGATPAVKLERHSFRLTRILRNSLRSDILVSRRNSFTHSFCPTEGDYSSGTSRGWNATS